MRINLRWRLTLFYALLSAAILLVVGTVFFLSLRLSLHDMLDKGLREAATLAASQLGGDDGALKFSEAETQALQHEIRSTTVLKVFNSQGTQTDSFGAANIHSQLKAGFTSTGGYRVYTLQLKHGEWVQAMRSEIETLETLSRAQRLLLLTMPLVLLAGLGAGYFIADRALQPVEEVTTLATRIAASGKYKDRVPELLGNDEMARLTQTFNAMLVKLEATIERERAFALAAAHELRTPLALLLGQTSLVLKRERNQEQYQKALREVEQTSLEMTSLVESLLMLAKTNTQVLQANKINLEDVVLEVSESLTALAKMHGVKFIFETKSAAMQADPTALRLLIANLIVNAIKYNKIGGRVWLRTTAEKQFVILEISDDGPGIEASEVVRLTQPFQRGLGLQGVAGSGLGLALAAAIAEQHNAKLELSHAAEGGLCARVIFVI